MPRSDGTVVIDTKIDMSGLNNGTVDIKRQFDKMSNSARITADTINGAFSKPLETARVRVESLESELKSVREEFKAAVADDDDVSAAKLGARSERLYSRLEAARRRLEIEKKAAAAREAQAEERAAQRTEAANRKAAEAARKVSSESGKSAKNMDGMAKSARRFKSRMREIVTGAFFFNIISSALTKLTQTIWGAVSSTGQMKSALSNLQGAAYTAASPLLNVLSSAFSTLANAVATALSYLTQLYSLLSGKSISALTQTAKEMGNVANAAGSAAGSTDKAKKSLAGFDEITTLSDQNSGGGGGDSVSTPNYDYNLDSGVNPQIEKLANKIKELLEPLQKIDFSKLKKSLSGLKEELKNLGKTIGNNLEWVWFNVLVPLADWFIEEAAPESVELLTAAIEALSSVLSPVTAGLQNIMSALSPVCSFIADTFISVLDDLKYLFEEVTKVFQEKGPQIEQTFANISDALGAAWNFMEPTLTGLRDIISDTFRTIVDLVTLDIGTIISVLEGLTQFVAGVFTGDWDRAWDGIVTIFEAVKSNISAKLDMIKTYISDKFGGALTFVQNAWGVLSTWFDTYVVKPISTTVSSVATSIGTWFKDAATALKTAWEGISGWFDKNVIQPMGKAFGGIFDAVIDVLTGETTFADLAKGFGDILKSALNSIIGGINGLIASAVNSLNTAIIKIKYIKFGGKYPFGAITTIFPPSIPYLAKGAVIPPNAPFMAMLGDQRHGTNIEAPLSTIQEAVAVVMEDMIQSNLAGHEATVAILREILEAILGIEIGDSVIGEAVDRYNRTMMIARGT